MREQALDSELIIRPYDPRDEEEVVSLWEKCNLFRPQNNPYRDIARKLKVNPELFLVGALDERIITTAMGGYEGHRGWVNYLAVDPSYRNRGYARQIMETLQDKLITLGCPKINLQVRKDNLEAILFYKRLGYLEDEVISLGKRLTDDR